MTSHNKTLLTAFIIPLTSLTLLAQVIIKRGSEGKEMKMEGEPFMLSEVGVVILATDGTLKVEHVMPKDNRPKAYTGIDLQEGDNILAANAKGVKTTKELKGLYDSLKTGEELKLGVKRNEEMFIVTLAKADQKDLPKMKIQLGGGDGGDFEVLPALGVVLKSEKNKVVISDKLPNESSALAKADVKEKDEIVEMNAKPVASLKKFIDTYDSLPVDSNVEWKLRRGGKTITISFKKPQPKGMQFRREVKK